MNNSYYKISLDINYLSVSADHTNIHLCTNTDFSTQTCIVQL